MTTLTNSKIVEIKNEIKSSKNFTLEDFNFEFPDYGDDLVTISFIPFDEYFLTIKEDVIKKEQQGGFGNLLSYDTKKVITVIVSPGNYRNEEVSHHENISGAINKISIWLENIRNELKNITADISQVTKETMDEIKENLDKSFPNEKEIFTNEEITDITEKLTILQTQVNKLEDELKITKEENIKIQTIIEQSTENLSIYPKKAWYFTTLNKFKNINSDIKILLEVKDNISNLIDYFK